MAFRITCVTLSPGGWQHEHIVEVGWRDDADGINRYDTREQIAQWINAGHVFYSGYGLLAPKVVTYLKDWVWYIRSEPNYTTTDNLLSLDRCHVTYLGRTG